MSGDLELLKGSEVAVMLRISERTLRRWRTEGTGPPCTRMGRQLLYKRADVVGWFDNNQAGSPA